MQHFRGILCMTAIVAATLVVGLGGQGWGRGAQPAEELPAQPASAAAAQASFDMIGARTCASTACHGSVRRDPRSQGVSASFIRRDEYVFWSDHDPHARSLLTLESERSQQMFAQLRIKNKQGEIIDERAYNNCRACHATKITDPVTHAISYESVSCEACHGPAETWRETHYQRNWNPSVAARSGFANTKNLAVRARQCVQCHVGAADREVNHDLIAAGHPVLKFELAAYHDMLPKHWNDARERAQSPGFELLLWNAGQQRTFEAALDLTHARLDRLTSTAAAERSPVKPAWPEFAEYDCFACHHDLVDNSWSHASDKDPAVLAGWNTWNLAGVTKRHLPAVNELKALMPQQLRSADAGLLAKVEAAQAELAMIKSEATTAWDRDPITQWDSAAQAYLLLAAQFRAKQDKARQANQAWPAEARIKQQLLELRRNLAFEPQYDSPRANQANLRDEMLRQLRSLDEHLSQGVR